MANEPGNSYISDPQDVRDAEKRAFGIRFRNLRQKNGYSQRSLAKALSNFSGMNIPAVTVSKWECGSIPRPVYLKVICEFFQTDPSTLTVPETVKNSFVPMPETHESEYREITVDDLSAFHGLPVWMEQYAEVRSGEYILIDTLKSQAVTYTGNIISFIDLKKNEAAGCCRLYTAPSPFSVSVRSLDYVPVKMTDLRSGDKLWLSMIGMSPEFAKTMNGWYSYSERSGLFESGDGIALPARLYGTSFTGFTDKPESAENG